MSNIFMYVYEATLIRVVDGDTVDLRIDLGFYMSAALRFRVMGIDTPELRGGTEETKAKARRAKEFVQKELGDTPGGPCTIEVATQKADSFGRWLAAVKYKPYGSDQWKDLATELLTAGLAVDSRFPK